MADRVAAVTGATGFLGRALVDALAGDGWRVRALVRRPPVEGLWRAPPEMVVGDFEDTAALRALVAGADAVIHAAGLIKARTAADFMRVNAEGSRAVAGAVGAQCEGRLILVSSLAARAPHLSPYALSKRAGEDAAHEALPASRLTIVRPPAVYGPGDRETLALFQAALRSPVLPRLGGEDARLALVHVADAADEIVRLAGRAEPAALVTLGGDRPDGYGWDELLRTAAAAVGRRPRLVSAPAALLHAAGRACELLTRLDGRPRMLTPGKVRELRHPDWSVRPGELGPERRAAAFSLTDGFADTVAWCRRAGWLPPASLRPLEPSKANL